MTKQHRVARIADHRRRALIRDDGPRAGFAEPADSGWRDDAACQHADPDIFYPEPGDAETAARAMDVCRACPVAEPCLADALYTREQFGIRGGLTPRQRLPLIAPYHRRMRHTTADRAPLATDGAPRAPRAGARQRASSGRTR